MVTVKDILNYIEGIAPSSLKKEWDNVGLLCGRKDRVVTKVLVALDPFEHVCHEAKDVGAELIVTHHPLIFDPLKAVTEDSEAGRCVLYLCENGISAINAHTNLDAAEGGVNDVLAKKLGLRDVCVLDGGHLRMGYVQKQPLADFLTGVEAVLGCGGIRYADGGKTVQWVAVGGGSCASEMDIAIAAGCDTFVTADAKYNHFRDAEFKGLNLIDAGHFCTENPVMAVVAEKLRAVFPEIEVLESKTHKDCVNFF